jgi:hypothetical protein
MNIQNFSQGLPNTPGYTTTKEDVVYNFNFRAKKTGLILQSSSLTQILSSEEFVIHNQPYQNMDSGWDKNFPHHRENTCLTPLSLIIAYRDYTEYLSEELNF